MKMDRPIRVAVLAERLGTFAGGTEVYERCVLKVLHELASECGGFEIVPVLAYRRAIEFLPADLRPATRILKPEGKLGTALAAGWSIRRLDADIVHCCFVVPPLLGRAPVVATVHDLGFVRRKEHYPFLLSWRLVKALQFAVRKADLITTGSDATRDDILELTDAHPEKVKTIQYGLDDRFVPNLAGEGVRHTLRKYGIREPYILYAGKLEPRKNVSTLIDAFDKLKSTGRFSGQLVLMGSRNTFFCEEAQGRIDRSAFRGDIVQTGFVPDNEVSSFYARARASAFVSLYEGFGFPVLEAMASGVPVVCSDSTCLPEIAGDAALLVDPMDSDRVADALFRVLHEEGLREELIRKGLERAKRFTWRHVGIRLLEEYRRLAAR